eukprot:COSAG02_NODE_5254_length_4494_cov_2.427759_2_plen_92_part_00
MTGVTQDEKDADRIHIEELNVHCGLCLTGDRRALSPTADAGGILRKIDLFAGSDQPIRVSPCFTRRYSCTVGLRTRELYVSVCTRYPRIIC